MKQHAFAASLVAAIAIAGSAPSQVPPQQSQARPGPWDADVALHRIDADGTDSLLHTFTRAGVPTLARLKDGRLIAAFQNFPKDDERNFDRVAVSFSSDDGASWTAPVPIVIDGLEAGLARAFDPTLVPLPDGRVRLYFTSNSSPDFTRSVPRIHSAISSDGVRYAFEPGVRLSVDGRIAIDCAVALHGGTFHMFVPDNGTAEDFARGMRERAPAPTGGAYHATSPDGLSFTRAADISGHGSSKFLGCAVSTGDGMLFFGSGPGPWPLHSGDGAAWQKPERAMRIPGADPGAVALRDGAWLVLVTTPPRPGTPSGAQRGPRDRPRISQGSLKVGNPAPDFMLSDVEGKNPVTLSSLKGKPTVLVFGSCTCPPFVESCRATAALHARYRDRVNFLMVYIKEAHPSGGGAVQGNAFTVTAPTSLDERCRIAREFDRRIGIDMPLVVDTIGDTASLLYSPWPNRMVIVDAQGRIADAGEAGPQGTARSAERAPEVLDRLLAQRSGTSPAK